MSGADLGLDGASGSTTSSQLQQHGSAAPMVSAMGDVMVGRMSMAVKVSEGAAKKVRVLGVAGV